MPSQLAMIVSIRDATSIVRLPGGESLQYTDAELAAAIDR